MQKAKLSTVKNQLSRYVEQARRGERVRILVRGRPAADLVPVEDLAESPRPDPELLKPGPKLKGRPLSEELVEARRRR